MRYVFAALAGLLVVCTSAGAQDGDQGVEVAVYLKLPGGERPRLVELMKQEAQALLRPAGVLLRWRLMDDARLHEDFPSLVVAHFAGACAPSRDFVERAVAERRAPLAETPVQDGHVLPFTRIDCAAVTSLTSQSMESEPDARRVYLYGRALGRVLAHELYHILGQTRTHVNHGVAKPAFHARELLAESFAFNEPAITAVRSGSGVSVPAPDVAAGR